MTDEQVCNYHHYGFCKFGTTCQKFHSQVTCSNFPCLDHNCKSRHPRICRYYSSFGRCKFEDTCAYLHYSPETPLKNVREEVSSLASEVLKLKSEKKEMEEKISKLAEEISSVRTLINFSKSVTLGDKSGREKGRNGQAKVAEDEVLKCEMCDYSTKTLSNLKRHRSK